MVSISVQGCIKSHDFVQIPKDSYHVVQQPLVLYMGPIQCPFLICWQINNRKIQWFISYHFSLEELGFWSGWHSVHARCIPKNVAAAADVLLNTFPAINHRLVSPAIYQQLLPRLGPGDGQYIRRQAQSLFTPLHRGKYIRFTGVNTSASQG